ncbi:MAG: ATP-binding cassette domain-containing protein, partial [Pseudolabrys sp.]
MSETLLELRDVTRTFSLSQGVFRGAATLTAVAGVSLKVQRGEVFALVGESGSGKTTLAKMLLGLLPPTSGEILIGGVPVTPKDRV